MSNATILLQETRAKLHLATVTLTQTRMMARGTMASATGAVGFIRGGGLISAAAGAGTVAQNLGKRMASLAAQKACNEAIAELMKRCKGSITQVLEIRRQIREIKTELAGIQQEALDLQDATMDIIDTSLEIVRLLKS